MNRLALPLFVVVVTAAAFTTINLISWQVKDDSYSIRFETEHASGTMKGLKGTIHFDEADITQSNFDVTVDVNTINTGNGLKNHHAKGSGFLDAEKYPVIRFASSKIEKTDTGFISAGNLTIKDVTHTVAIPFKFDNRGNEGVFKGNFVINRNDYHLDRNGVGEVIKIELNIPVKK